MNKKGFSTTQYILFAVTAVLIIFVFAALFEYLGDESGKSKCQMSVLNSISNDGILNLDCPVQEIEITTNDFENELAKPKVAEAMRDCWDSMGRGNNKPFYKDLVGWGDVVCKKCAEIENVRKITGMQDFISNNEALRVSTTYEDYIYSDHLDWKTKVVDELPAERVNYVYFRVCKASYQNLPFSCDDMKPDVVLLTGQQLNDKDLGCDYEFE